MPPVCNSPLMQNYPSESRAGSGKIPAAFQRSEFEDFMNAYRPTLDVPRKGDPRPRVVVTDESKGDLGRSIKKLMKRTQTSPNIQSKNRREGIQRTGQDRERSVTNELRPAAVSIEKKAKRPWSLHVDISSSGEPSQLTEVNPVVHPVLEHELTSARNGERSRVDKSISDSPKVPVEAIVIPVPPSKAKPPSPSAVQKKSVQEVAPVLQRKHQATDPSFSSEQKHCLIIASSMIGRFLPARHNPDPLLSLRVMEIPERKYHVILEFEESPRSQKPKKSVSGLLVIAEDDVRSTAEQRNTFCWLRETRLATEGMLLTNVERSTEFPYVTYLVVNANKKDLYHKMAQVKNRPMSSSQQQLHFLAGYEEAVTVAKPPLPNSAPEQPTSERTGFVISLYQVLPGDDREKFEQNWVMWTGARHLYRNIPVYMGLKRISIHKSILPTNIINYALVCEFSYIMDYVTEACVFIDNLRARCCGFTGLYRILDML